MSPTPITTHNLGFPRIGARRELKQALEAYWRGDTDRQALESTGRELRRRHWQQQGDAGLDLVPTGDFAWYDQVLTLSATLDNLPARHHRAGDPVDLDTLFRVARGSDQAPAAAMKKWFDTNYHYLVPEFRRRQTFALAWRQIIDETAEAVALGHAAKPVILGPLSYLWLGKAEADDFDRLELIPALLVAYQDLLQALADAGAQWVQIDEPILALDLPSDWQRAFERVYHTLKDTPLKILLATYFGPLQDNMHTAVNLPVAGLHIDAVRGPEQILSAVDNLAVHKVLSVGIVDGRNIWRNNLQYSLEQLEVAHRRIGDRLWLAPSCSLLHVPVDLSNEQTLDPTLKSWLAFATQKTGEVVTLGRLLGGVATDADREAFAESRRVAEDRRHHPLTCHQRVRERAGSVTAQDCRRQSPFTQRIGQQQSRLDLPLFPTTTIGSFPQTAEIRRIRRERKQGNIGDTAYTNYMKDCIRDAIQRQETLDLDVLVHGEAERNDMVEYFGEQLEGYAFTAHGWVQSYGSRCVKPPVIYGDVRRPGPMTVEWIRYAQTLTPKPVKGMLTGPVTMLQWAFVRDDQPRHETAMQIALALRDEVGDLEAAGTRIIQIDEPALREGLPLRRADWRSYLDWAVKAFRLASSGVRDATQIHTHMCYSEFNDIIEAVAALDADVVTIETSRSRGELLSAFEAFDYPNQIGPGVYDIHSPAVPSVDGMVAVLERAARKLPADNLWVNPDCGLKTRGWPETEAALQRMVEAATILRERFSPVHLRGHAAGSGHEVEARTG
ncbi:MAG: 5-methyltetrahydropteroyltriglutamate--homocysteine S-methyltransferase [Pseudohongiellaceae bacterium]